MTISTKLDMSGLERIERELLPKAEALVNKTAFDLQGRAQNNAPVDTSALRNSIYTVTRKSDGFQAAASVAQTQNPKVEIAPIPSPTEELAAHVGPSVEYGIYQELGTVHIGAHPFLVPAVESLRSTWKAAWKALFESLT